MDWSTLKDIASVLGPSLAFLALITVWSAISLGVHCLGSSERANGVFKEENLAKIESDSKIIIPLGGEIGENNGTILRLYMKDVFNFEISANEGTTSSGASTVSRFCSMDFALLMAKKCVTYSTLLSFSGSLIVAVAALAGMKLRIPILNYAIVRISTFCTALLFSAVLAKYLSSSHRYLSSDNASRFKSRLFFLLFVS